MPTQDDPPKFDHAAPKWFQDYMLRLWNWLRENRVVEGLNCSVTDTPGGGRRIDVATGSIARGQGFPFQVSVSSDHKFRVNLGTINNLVPTGTRNWVGYTPGDVAVLSVITNGKQVISASIIKDTLPSPPDCVISAAPTSFKVPIAILNDASADQIWFTNMAAHRVLCHQTERTYPINPVGSSPFINWWTWEVVPEQIPQFFPMA